MKNKEFITYFKLDAFFYVFYVDITGRPVSITQQQLRFHEACLDAQFHEVAKDGDGADLDRFGMRRRRRSPRVYQMANSVNANP